jgi:branched-chain amino acid transport system permease protein
LNARALNFAGLAIVGVLGIAFLLLAPRFADLDTVLELTVYMIMAILALSLALVWGYGGILCFGQSAFFGLGAYTYAIAMFNIDESTIPFLMAIAAPAAFAALLGYFIFYGRISDVYLGVITLTVTLILFNSVNSTAGPEFHIGAAKLGGFNGIPGIPSLNIPGDKNAQIDLEGMFYLSTALLLATYFGLRLLLASHLAASSSASARTSDAPNCWATTPGPTSLQPSSSARRSPASPVAFSPIGALSSARRSSVWRNPRRSSSG